MKAEPSVGGVLFDLGYRLIGSCYLQRVRGIEIFFVNFIAVVIEPLGLDQRGFTARRNGDGTGYDGFFYGYEGSARGDE
jgi:hypothetical protein